MIDINRQIREEEQRWANVVSTFKTGSLLDYYRAYLEYLEKRQSYSNSALFIKETVKKTIEYLENNHG